MYLQEYTNSFETLTNRYVLSEEQLYFTGTPKECIELSNVDKERHSILAINDYKLVTFFVLHEKNGVIPYSDNKNAILLRAFSTDFRYQGKGYAKKSLLLLPDFSRKNYKNIDEIILAVNKKNIIAQSLYANCGFIDKGIRKMGKKGELTIMHYPL